jgi:hypothetical protein
VDRATINEESQCRCTKYQNIANENMQCTVHQTQTAKHIYHPSMRPPKSHMDSIVYDPRHPRQPQQLRYQQWRPGAPAKHDESPWESRTSKQPFKTMVVQAGLQPSFHQLEFSSAIS